jgi:hypothetical protein
MIFVWVSLGASSWNCVASLEVASFEAGFVGRIRIASISIAAIQSVRRILNGRAGRGHVGRIRECRSAQGPSKVVIGCAGLAVLRKVSENQLRWVRLRLRWVATNYCYERSRASASMSLRSGSMIWINQLRWSASQPASLKRDR